jgi:RimJ/RimL family protein N-acetyltransferase
LVLRHWHESDRLPFRSINADPAVMRFMPDTLSHWQSDLLMESIAEDARSNAFGLYAAELKADRTFIGLIGLSVPDFHASFTSCVEIGWRLSAHVWNQGLATEGATRAVVHFAFENLELESLVSFTALQNLASQRVMQKVGMTHNQAEDFDHPNLPEGHRLRRHVLYRLRVQDWRSGVEQSAQL